MKAIQVAICAAALYGISSPLSKRLPVELPQAFMAALMLMLTPKEYKLLVDTMKSIKSLYEGGTDFVHF